ncbi:hypothetical protein ACW9IB_21515 [Pseudomonas sp. SDO524_S393]
MQKIGHSTSTANGAGEFTSGQPGSGIDATMIMAAWLNSVQRELANVAQATGQPLDPADDAQVLKAIKALQEAASTWSKLSGKPTTISGFGITDAYTRMETAVAIEQAVAALVGASPEALDTLKELADALGNDPHFATTVTNALASKAAKATSLAGYGILDAYTRAQVDALLQGFDSWGLQPIGVPIGLLLDGATQIPPLNKSYRYITLTASDSYNTGVLTSEVVSGSFPLVTATAVINSPGSPLHGRAVNLINTEQRVLRAGVVAGELLQDALQNITGESSTFPMGNTSPTSGSGAFKANARGGVPTGIAGGGAWGSVSVDFDASRVARTAAETRVKSIAVTYFLRIK